MKAPSPSRISRACNFLVRHLDRFPQEPDERTRSRFGFSITIMCFIVMLVYLSVTLSNIAKQPVTVSSAPYPIPDGEDISIPYNDFYITMPTNIDPSAFMVFAQYMGDTTTMYPFGPCTPPDMTANPLYYCIMNDTLTILKNGIPLTVILKIKDAYCDSMSGIYQFVISHYLGGQVDYQKAKWIEQKGYREFFPVGMDKNAYNMAGINFQQQKISLSPGIFSNDDEREIYNMLPQAVNYASSDCHSTLSGNMLVLGVGSGVNINATFYKATDFISLMTAFAGFVYGVAAVFVSLFFAVKRKWEARKNRIAAMSPRTTDMEKQSLNKPGCDNSILSLKNLSGKEDQQQSCLQGAFRVKSVDSSPEQTRKDERAHLSQMEVFELDKTPSYQTNFQSNIAEN